MDVIVLREQEFRGLNCTLSSQTPKWYQVIISGILSTEFLNRLAIYSSWEDKQVLVLVY